LGGGEKMNRNIKPVLNILRTLDVASLKNYEVVANLVRLFGIMPWVLAGTVEGPEVEYVNPPYVAAIGQTPDQIAKALVYLSDYKINSYCEIGIYYAGNFLFVSEYLRRFNPGIQCLGVDPNNYVSQEIRERVELSDWMRFATVTSEQIVGRKFDLVLIDGDHSAPWPGKDWENVGKYANICMFHDLQDSLWPDVVAFWGTLKGKKVEFLDTWEGRVTHGIGLIHNKEVKNASKL
jgi:hypothetical protein